MYKRTYDSGTTQWAPRPGSIRDLAEYYRQKLGDEMRQNRIGYLQEPEDSDQSVETDSMLGEDDSVEIELAYHGTPGGGDLFNWTDITIYIIGEPGKDKPQVVRAVRPGGSDADGFDADFFKLKSAWYKITGCVWVKKILKKYLIIGLVKELSGKDASWCQGKLDEYLKKK